MKLFLLTITVLLFTSLVFAEPALEMKCDYVSYTTGKVDANLTYIKNPVIAVIPSTDSKGEPIYICIKYVNTFPMLSLSS